MSSASISVRERRERTLLVFFYVALSLTAVIWFAPIVMLIFTALKSAGDFAIHGALAIPTSIAWSNFSDAWDTGVKDYFWNSVIITSIKVPLGVVIEAMAAFALTHIPFRWANKIFILILLGLIVPIQMALVPLTISDERFESHRYSDRSDLALLRLRGSLRGLDNARILSDYPDRVDRGCQD